MPDIDIDLLDRDKALDIIRHVPASIYKESKITNIPSKKINKSIENSGNSENFIESSKLIIEDKKKQLNVPQSTLAVLNKISVNKKFYN